MCYVAPCILLYNLIIWTGIYSTLNLAATPNYPQFILNTFRPILGCYEEFPVTRNSYQVSVLCVKNSVMKFFITDFDWNVFKVFCSLQDFVKHDGRVNSYYLI
jgi:hypothetical protein